MQVSVDSLRERGIHTLDTCDLVHAGGLQAGVGSLSSGVLSGSTATSSLLNSGGNLTTFAVQGILRPGQ